MYVQGVSTRKVSKIVEELCGHSISSSQVSACAAKLDVELQLWRDRPLGAYPYLIFDARYEKVRHGGLLVDCAVLIAIGTPSRILQKENRSPGLIECHSGQTLYSGIEH
jgi:putative transposase